MESIRQIVLLHGWGCDGRIWQQALPFFNAYANTKIIDIEYVKNGEKQSLDQLCQTIAKQIPEGSVLCGWSLGGMLAARIAALYPEKAKGLITLASNVVFVANEQWQHAMPVEIFNQFFSLFKKNAQQGLNRFMLLEVHGDKQAKEQLSFLKTLLSECDEQNLIQGLALLKEINNIDYVKNILCPGLYCFGENDALVPSQAGEAIALQNSTKQKVVVIPDSGHLLHYPNDKLTQWLSPFLSELCHGNG